MEQNSRTFDGWKDIPNIEIYGLHTIAERFEREREREREREIVSFSANGF